MRKSQLALATAVVGWLATTGARAQTPASDESGDANPSASGSAVGTGSSGVAPGEATAPSSAQPSAPSGEAGANTAARADLAPSDFNQELLTLEERVHSLKERVFRAKATLQLLKEIVVQGSTSGARATIWHVDKLGKGYMIESVAYYLDGQGKFSRADTTGQLDADKEFKVFDGAIPAGSHNVTVNLKLRGTGYGIFSYVENYSFNVQASTTFTAERGKSCQVRVVAGQRRGIGRSFTERPNITFDTRCIRVADTTGGE